MSIKNKIIFAVFIIFCVCFLFYALFSGGQTSRTTRFFVFNAPCRVTFWGHDDVAWDSALSELLPKMQSLNDCLNIYDPNSELSRLNATAFDRPFVCTDQLWDVLSATRKAWQDTDHAYDPSVGPLMSLWGFHAKRETVPTQQEINAALLKVGLAKVVFDDDEKSVRFTVEGMSLDCGGIAKGYACDVANEILSMHGITTFLLDLGGNLMLSEMPPKGQHGFVIGIRDPFNKGEIYERLHLTGVAVATSGNYERSRVIDGKRIGHIMDPETGSPGEFRASVTAITPRGVDSDAFSTAVFVRGKPLADKLEKAMPNTRFIIL